MMLKHLSICIRELSLTDSMLMVNIANWLGCLIQISPITVFFWYKIYAFFSKIVLNLHSVKN